MKVLKIVVSGLPLFSEKCEIDFFALQRVDADDVNKMTTLFSYNSQNYYLNNVISFVGINASGKTTILKMITFVLKMLNNDPINNSKYCEIFDGLEDDKEVVFDTYFYAENKSVNCLHTIITRREEKFYITDENLCSRSASSVKSKDDVFNFNSCEPIMRRDNNIEFLSDDVSIMIAFNKRNKERLHLSDMLGFTDSNRLMYMENLSPELIAFFDPSIEYLHIKKDGKDSKEKDIRLKFKGRDEIVLSHIDELNRYLSSGTIKGINTFSSAVRSFETGGYLIVDELENHFNHEIVSTLIRFYMDKKVNPRGATLIFSTHYAELLDEFERKDNIYIVRNQNGITTKNFTFIIDRNDIKKSEAYLSGYLGGTTPMYEAYTDLKKSIMRSGKGDV